MKAKIVVASRLLEAETTAIQVIVVVCLLPGNSNEPAIERVIPAVIAANKGLRMSLFCTTECIAAMTARIQKNVDLAGLVADGDDLILADIVDEVVAGIRNLRVVADEIPAPREDPLQFELVERFVGMNPPVQPTCFRIEQRADGRAVPPIVCIVSFLCHFHAPGLWASLSSEAWQNSSAATPRRAGPIVR